MFPARLHRRGRLTSLLLAGTCAALLMVGVAPAGAQDYPISGGDLDLTITSGGDATLDPGDAVRVVGEGFEAGSDVTITIESQPATLATTTADAQGAIDVTVNIPPGFASGDHTIKATGDSPTGSLVLATAVQVGDSAPATLPLTGTSVLITVLIAVALAAIGFGLVRVSRHTSHA